MHQEVSSGCSRNFFWELFGFPEGEDRKAANMKLMYDAFELAFGKESVAEGRSQSIRPEMEGRVAAAIAGRHTSHQSSSNEAQGGQADQGCTTRRTHPCTDNDVRLCHATAHPLRPAP